MTQSIMELGCMTTVGEYTSIVLHSRRAAVASFVADRCYMGDTFDLYSS